MAVSFVVIKMNVILLLLLILFPSLLRFRQNRRVRCCRWYIGCRFGGEDGDSDGAIHNPMQYCENFSVSRINIRLHSVSLS